jgi:hypothetical protein
LYIAAAFPVVDLIAVANVEALLGAVSPDRVLNKPRKGPWKPSVELPGVNVLGDRFDDFGATARPVAREAIGMVGSEPVQDPGPVEEIVHEGVDRDHAAADFEPAAPTAWRAEEQDGQGHHQNLVGDAVDFFQRVEHSLSHSGQPVGPGLLGGGIQAPVDPADQVAASNVANEQVQGIRGLVQPSVAQPMTGQRAARQVIGLGAGVPGLVVSAAVKMPVAVELRAAWLPTQVAGNSKATWSEMPW